MTALLVLLLLGVLIATLQARRPAGAAPKRSKRPSAINPYWLLGALLLGAVLLRFGVNWLVVAGGVVVAAVRSLLPLLRFLPLLQSLHRGARPSAGGWAPPGASGSSGSRERPRRMTREEALQVLGLDESATRDDVQREYRRLMRKVHPDLGGSSYLAAKLNEAKDVLS